MARLTLTCPETLDARSEKRSTLHTRDTQKGWVVLCSYPFQIGLHT